MAFLFGSRKKTPEQLVGLAVTALHELSEADDGTAEADTAKLQGDLKKRLSQMVALLMASPQDDVPEDAVRNLGEALLAGRNGGSEPSLFLRLVHDMCCAQSMPFDARNSARQLLVHFLRPLPSAPLAEQEGAATSVLPRPDPRLFAEALVRHRPAPAAGGVRASPSLVEMLVRGYERSDTALYTGSVLREAVKHEAVCRALLAGNGAPDSPPLFWRFFPAEVEEDRAVRAVTAGMSSEKSSAPAPAPAPTTASATAAATAATAAAPAAPAPPPAQATAAAPPTSHNQGGDKDDAGAGAAAGAGADIDESKDASQTAASASAAVAAAAATSTSTSTSASTGEDQPMGYLQLPNFEAASDAFATLRALLTSAANKSLVAQFLKPLDVDNPPPQQQQAGKGGGASAAGADTEVVTASGGDGGHPDAYSTLVARFKVLLMSSNFMVVLQSLKLLADVILEPKNFHVMMRFIASNSNLVMMMKLLGRKHAKIQFEAFHIFKVFVANPDKRPGIVGILKTNKDKLIRFLGDFHTEKDSDEFKQEKALLIRTLKKL